MAHCVTVLPENRILSANNGDSLLTLLRSAQLLPDAPCGGNGTCGKCRVLVDGQTVLACQTRVDGDMTVPLPQHLATVILTDGINVERNADSGLCLAVDIGTTTVAAYLTENGRLLATESRKNPQAAFGADVVSRLQQAAGGQLVQLTALIRSCLGDMTQALLERTGKCGLRHICIVGNPAMQQLFLGLPVENLTRLPYAPILQKSEISDGGAYVPAWKGASLLTVPDIAGFIGADPAGFFGAFSTSGSPFIRSATKASTSIPPARIALSSSGGSSSSKADTRSVYLETVSPVRP